MQASDRAWKHESIPKHWYNNRIETTVEYLFHIRQRIYWKRILTAAHTNNAVDEIEEQLLDGIMLCKAETL